ncbi:hypothetical protein AA12717_1020 [Gluconacetobacter sacchari DSM 12717]|uniref:Glycosyl hydrolase family 31 C-terminal domain-containing protein n=1 Tax=Gluconacetobacter sacchari DSM 12717 TaxID=1307940 RepID=A0ABQ0P4E7_9PROT|nr:hypothetical protein AA12717_1020 [Gluconacetobacter sacchari DSM 12717]
MMRPLFLEFPNAANGFALDLQAPGEFMWGPDLLVAPPQFLEQTDNDAVMLPPGAWYDYWSARKDRPGPCGRPPAGIYLRYDPTAHALHFTLTTPGEAQVAIPLRP